jgi:type VI secretion system secreted protein Hcp
VAEYMFIRFDGIKGTSVQANFTDYVEVMNFSHSCDYAVSPGSLSTAGTSVTHSPFVITKSLDKSSPELLNHLNQRLAVTKIQFEMLTDDIAAGGGKGGKKLIYKVTLSDCRIVNVSCSGSDGAGMPVESVAIAYGKIEWNFDSTPAAHSFKDWAAGK